MTSPEDRNSDLDTLGRVAKCRSLASLRQCLAALEATDGLDACRVIHDALDLAEAMPLPPSIEQIADRAYAPVSYAERILATFITLHASNCLACEQHESI